MQLRRFDILSDAVGDIAAREARVADAFVALRPNGAPEESERPISWRFWRSVVQTAGMKVGLVTVDVKDVAKGYRANSLRLKPVMNDKGELIGRIDDFMFGRDDGVFVVLDVGNFVGLDGQLVAVPFKSLKLDDPQRSIVLPGASKAALLKLPVFFFNR